MIGPGTGVNVYLACGVTDMRRGIEDKLRILREAFAPGAVVADVARRHDVRAPQIYQ